MNVYMTFICNGMRSYFPPVKIKSNWLGDTLIHSTWGHHNHTL